MKNPKDIIPYGRQQISDDDVKAVTDVLKSDFLTQGPQVPLFEKSVSDYCGGKYGVAVNSATSALHIACLALELGEGDWLWTSPNSYVASSNCGLYCGANIDFVDVDPKTYNLCVDELEKKLILAEKAHKLPKILVTVHFAGQSCEMKKIRELSNKFGFFVIEDASHCIGGKYLNKPIGSCDYSDIAIFSFHPVKIITTAEGGMATTNSKKFAERMDLFRSHGVTRNQKFMLKENEGPWHYQQIDLGFNYRMTDLQAVLGISQMKKIDEFVSKRHILKKRYEEKIKRIPVIKPYQHSDSYSALHLFPIQLELEQIEKSRKETFNELRDNGIGVNVHYIPIHTQPYYEKLGFKKGDFPNSEYYYSRAITLPLFHDMTFDQQDKVCEVLKDILK